MLKKFTVSNYRKFENPISIDFSKVRDYKFNEICIKNELVNKSVLYGKNAVGKTNLAKAIIDIRNMFFANEILETEKSSYINANFENTAARFEYVFVINDIEIEFIYEKKSADELKYEMLKINHEILYEFHFDKNSGDFSALKKYDELRHLNLDEWNNELSVIRYILTNAKLRELSILKDFSAFVEGMAAMRTTENGARFTGPTLSKAGNIKLIIDENLVEEFSGFLGKSGVHAKLKVDTNPDGERHLYFDFKRPLEFLSNASSGTKALTAIFVLMHNLKNITFLYVDEYGANFHFELADTILEEFKKKETCQVIISTHNTDLMSNKFMRPDCYFLMLPDKIVNVADATRRELRLGHNLEKLYQSGEFDEMAGS